MCVGKETREWRENSIEKRARLIKRSTIQYIIYKYNNNKKCLHLLLKEAR